ATEISPSAQTFTRAGAYLRRHEWHADSIPMFRKAADLKPSANAYTYWGMALRDLGKHDDEARDLFQKAIATDKTSPNGYNQLGLLYLDEGKGDEAADNFNMAIKYSPEWSNYHYNLGVALRRAGKPEQAKPAFEKAIALYQSHAGSRAALDELDQSHPKARMELEELEGPEGPPKVDQTTVGRKTSEETLTLPPLPAGGREGGCTGPSCIFLLAKPCAKRLSTSASAPSNRPRPTKSVSCARSLVDHARAREKSLSFFGSALPCATIKADIEKAVMQRGYYGD